MKRKLITAITTSLFLCSLTIVSFAYTVGNPHQKVTLDPQSTYAETVSVAGTHKWFCGDNYSSSEHKVYFDARRSAGDKYVVDTSILVDEGASLNNTLTNYTGSTVLWKLELNPYGLSTRGCSAIGYIWYDM